jgi:drug/metabolite transporter (DMT)-like permease
MEKVFLTEIIVAVAIATLVLGEVLTVISGVGALFIIIAILLVSWNGQDSKELRVSKL